MVCYMKSSLNRKKVSKNYGNAQGLFTLLHRTESYKKDTSQKTYGSSPAEPDQGNEGNTGHTTSWHYGRHLMTMKMNDLLLLFAENTKHIIAVKVAK